MVTLLDCIQRVPDIAQKIIAAREENIGPLLKLLGPQAKALSEIVLVGSGTSATSGMTSRRFIEKATGVRTLAVTANVFLHDFSVYPADGLYIFTSQSGSSSLMNEGLKKMKKMGRRTVAITEAPGTLAGKSADVHVDMGCGYEEYGMRTIGYCASVLTQMLIGLELGRCTGALTDAQYEEYLAQARRVPASHREISARTLAWFDRNREKLLNSRMIALSGAGCLWGDALEGALKITEITNRMAIGFELEDGLHGPTCGYHEDTCVLVMNDGGRENEKALSLGRFAKNEKGNGFVAGQNVVDETDLQFDVQAGEFCCLEFAPVFQILGYRLAVDSGMNLNGPFEFRESKYFHTHEMPAAEV